jgi:AcrR family transcriptional regulator
LGRIHAAMIDLVAERGYDAVAVRELTRRAEISSRSFYKHYAGKEECLLAVHRLVASKALRRLSEAQAEASEPINAIRLAVTRIVFDWGTAPSEAHLLLVAPYRAGTHALDQLRQTEEIFRARLERNIVDVGIGGAASAIAAQAILDGLVAVGSLQLVDGDAAELEGQASQLAEWACDLVGPTIGSIDGFRESRWGKSSRKVPTSDPVPTDMRDRSNNDVALLLAAVTKLVARNPDKTPTPDEIVAVAGLARTAFHANFPDVESCVAAALDSKLEPQAAGSLCGRIASDPKLRSFCGAGAVAAMISTRLRLQSLLAVELRDPVIEAKFGARVADLRAQASAGALWGLFRHRLTGPRAEETQGRLAHLMSLTLAPTAGGREAIGVMEQEQTFSVA